MYSANKTLGTIAKIIQAFVDLKISPISIKLVSADHHLEFLVDPHNIKCVSFPFRKEDAYLYSFEDDKPEIWFTTIEGGSNFLNDHIPVGRVANAWVTFKNKELSLTIGASAADVVLISQAYAALREVIKETIGGFSPRNTKHED